MMFEWSLDHTAKSQDLIANFWHFAEKLRGSYRPLGKKQLSESADLFDQNPGLINFLVFSKACFQAK